MKSGSSASIGSGSHSAVGVLDGLLPEDVTPLGHRRVGPAAVEDDDVLERVELLCDVVDLLLHGKRVAAAQRGVRGDECLRLRELHALAHGLGREAAEDDVVDRADARAAEHRGDGLGDHRHVDADDVALADAEVLEHVRKALDLVEEPVVGDLLAPFSVAIVVGVLGLPVERDAIAVAGGYVAVEAVGGDVQLAAVEPLRVRRVGPVENVVPRLDPLELLGPARPPCLAVRRGLLVDAGVGDVRVGSELVGGGKVSSVSMSTSSSGTCTSSSSCLRVAVLIRHDRLLPSALSRSYV